MVEVVGLDLSLNATGLANNDGAYVIHPRKGEVGVPRLHTMKGRVMVACDCDLVMLEGYSFGSKGRAVFQIAEFGGVIRLALYEKGIPFAIVPPQVRAKYMTGRGNAPKAAVVAAAAIRSGIEFGDDNEADAWVLWLMGMDKLGVPPVVMPALNRTALDHVEWPEDIEGLVEQQAQFV